MKNCVPKFSRPIALDTKTWRYVEPIFKASQQAQQLTGRFKSYGCLVAVYRTYKEWKDLGISKKMARRDDWALDSCPLNIVAPKKPKISAFWRL
jgi:hypothetical protein